MLVALPSSQAPVAHSMTRQGAVFEVIGSARSAASASLCRLSQISVSRSRIMSAVGRSLISLARSRHLASLASSSALSCDEPILIRPAFREKVRAAIYLSIFALNRWNDVCRSATYISAIVFRAPGTIALPSRHIFFAQGHLRRPKCSKPAAGDAQETQSCLTRDLTLRRVSSSHARS